MRNIVFDPTLLVVPTETAECSEVEAWLNALEMWARATASTPHSWYHLTDQVIKYLSYERFINFRQLRTLMQRHHLNIALPTITTLVNDVFLQDTLSFRSNLETHLLEYGLIVEPKQDTIELQPDDLSKHWPEVLRNVVTALLAEAGAGKWKGEPFSKNVTIATTSHQLKERELRVAGEVMILSTQEEQEDGSFSATFPLVSTPEELAPTNVRAIWEQGEHGVLTAIERQFRRDWQSIVPHSLPFILGPQFLTSVHERGADTNNIVVTKIVHIAAAVIADRAMTIKCDLHPLRETAAPNSLQRLRANDGAKAWRLMLTDKGAGWRMHYWRIPGKTGSSIEFSNILKKHEPEVIF